MIKSFSSFGYEGSIVYVEVDLRRGIPCVDIVGLSDSCVKESRNRIIAAIKNSGLSFPEERILIALSPADLRKEGASFDLPIALAVFGQHSGLELKEDILVIGELALSGEVLPVNGVNAALQTAKSNDIKYAIVPFSANLKIPVGMAVTTVKSLEEAYTVLKRFSLDGDKSDFVENYSNSDSSEIEFEEVSKEESLDSINGMNGLKFAMAVAVAGRHNIMAVGSPGCGKTMTLQRMPSLMPKLLPNEKQSVERIYSIAGLESMRVDSRPFRMPHQTASIEGIIGGGVHCRPGEISLAHNGVLFLDEVAEFRSSVLQMLRVPLESKQITLSRAGRTTVYPANFQLAMAVNPCPCGNLGHKDRICFCSAKSVELYWKKFSAPLLDRVGIKFDCNTEDTTPYYSLEELRNLVKKSWEVQHTRQGKLNEELNPKEVMDFIKLDAHAESHLSKCAEKMDLSPRAVVNLKKIARTIQDMTDGAEEVNDISLCTAMSLSKTIPYGFM